MQLQATQTRPAGVLANPAPGRPAPPLHALVVSSELEVRKQLIRMLEALLVDVIVCSSGTQAAEVLSQQPFEIVYCDEHLADGMYSDLIRPTHSEGQIPRVVVTTRTGDWDLYFEAIGRGAFDVIRCPCCITDVEMTLIRALRDDGQHGISHVGV